MPLIPLQLPAGFYRNGTDLEGSGRWRDGSLVRWREGSLRPVGGWTPRGTTSFTAPPRGLHAWQKNNSERQLAGGTYNSLIYVASDGTPTDITPVGLTAGRIDAAASTGYSAGFYGTGFYGQPREGDTFLEATTWSLDNWGEYLVACNADDGKIYEWQLNTATPAQQLANAPVDNLGIVVTEERFIFALGSDGDPRRIDWCDQEDNTTWLPASTNQAGSQKLQTSGEIMTAHRTIGQTLVLTSVDAHRAVYVGPPFVYQFERVGTSCGIVARKAAATVDAGVFWMGLNNFFLFDGSSVREVPCEVHDHVFSDINSAQISKVWAVANAQHGEIWWFYPSEGSVEINKYVAYDYKENHWLIGELDRTCGVDRSVYRTPIWADASGNVYNHEIGYNYSGNEIFAESGPANFGDGEFTFNAKKLIPDERTQGDVTLTFKTRLYPNGAETSHGPYTMSNPTSIRFSGRQARMRVTANTETDWRFGIPRIEVSQAGRR